MKKILIAIPTFETITAETFKAVYDIRRNPDYELSFDYVKGYDCAIARNNIAKKAIDGGFNYVLMVDSDIIVPPDVLEKMLEYPVDICFGIYPRKNTQDKEAEIFKLNDGDYTDRFKFDELDGQVRVAVKGGGFGCVLINTALFMYLNYPWFQYVAYSKGTYLSEDLYFCDLAKFAGFKLEADARVRCGHLTRRFQYE